MKYEKTNYQVDILHLTEDNPEYTSPVTRKKM